MIGMIPEGLILLTSVAMAVGVIKLARRKTLVQELSGIETLARADVLCLDKTGTITKGNFVVQKANPVIDGMSEDELLLISASCELSSTHPIGNSIVDAAREKGLEIELGTNDYDSHEEK